MMDTRKSNHGTVTHLEKIEFLQNNLLAAHTVWVNNTEVNYFFLLLAALYLNSLDVLSCSCLYYLIYKKKKKNSEDNVFHSKV